MRLDPSTVRQEISNLRLSNPEIWDDEDEQLLSDMLSGSTSLDEFLTVVEDRRQDAAGMAGAIAGRIAELSIRQSRYVAREKSMRTLALKVMQIAGVRKCELPDCTFSIRAGSQSVAINDEQSVPDEYVRLKVERVPDKPKIKDALQGGSAFNWAALVTSDVTLSVRTK